MGLFFSLAAFFFNLLHLVSSASLAHSPARASGAHISTVDHRHPCDLMCPDPNKVRNLNVRRSSEFPATPPQHNRNYWSNRPLKKFYLLYSNAKLYT